MKKTKYYYNTSSLRYEEVKETWKSRTIKTLLFISAVSVAAILVTMLSFFFFDSPKERRLARENKNLQHQFTQMNSQLNLLNEVLEELAEKDDNIYRVIFEAEPVSSSVRAAGQGGANKYKELEGYENTELLRVTAGKLDKVQQKLAIQSMSYDEISRLIKSKNDMLASIPSIQPVANKTLKRIASGYGYRIHPIHKIKKFHRGIDFTAPRGTNIFATGNGVVKKVSKSKRGYGHHVVIDHGYSYETLYAHMTVISVKKGQKVERGEIIGTIGSSGLSTAPHLHYEVHYQGKAVDPINFFHGDLDETEFQKVVDLANRSNQSFD